jgi:hypothetical protein
VNCDEVTALSMHLKKRLLRIFLALLAAALVVVVAAHFLSKYVESKTRNILAAIPMNASTINASILTRTIELGSVDWTQPNDSLPQFPHHLFVNKLRLEGISVYQLLAKNKMHIHKIVFDVGEFQLNRGLKKPKSEVKELNIDLENVTIDKIVIKDVYTKVFTDSLAQYEGIVSLNLDNVVIGDLDSIRELTSYEVESFDALITKMRIKGRKDMYTSSISKIYANSVEGRIEIDSVILVPKYSRYQFARKLGRQVDRMNLLIPKISINDLSFAELKDSLFRAATIDIKSAKLYIYKDKRLPFIRDITPLPIAMIRDLEFGIAIDTLKLIDAKVTYEEFPEEGYHPGYVTFEKLNATLDHLTNRNHYPDYKQATLKASSYVMGKGLLKAEFSLPYGKSQVYNAKGGIDNFSLYRLNPILENLAFMSVTSGRLNHLAFNFDYTDLKANGTVLVNYENLKINSLTKEKEPEKNEIKTFVVNTILKKNKTEKMDKERRRGTVEFDRDRRRAIFHYWWRSLLSGIKSSALDSPRKKENDRENGKKNDKEKKKK